MTLTNATLIALPLAWWRLPFALALFGQNRILHRCQLCQIRPCMAHTSVKMAKGSHAHWFNRLTYLCDECHHATQWQAANFQLDLSHSAFVTMLTGMASTSYQLPYAECMREFKNHSQFHRLGVLVHALRQLERPPGCHGGNSLIIAVPTSHERLIERGFDPVHWLAQYLSFHWQIPLFMGVKRDARRHQQGLTREARLDNMRGAFSIAALPPTSHLIIFDDVVTTGATLQSLIDVLPSAIHHRASAHPLPTLHIRSVLHGYS